MLSRQKLALTLILVAVGLTAMGRWSISNPNLRERDVLAIFGGGFVAGLAVVRFVQQTRQTPKSDATAGAAAGDSAAPPAMSATPTPPPPPRSKS